MSIEEIIEQTIERTLSRLLPQKLEQSKNQQAASDKVYLSEKEAINRYAISRTDLFKARTNGKLAYRQDGRSIRYAVIELEAFLETRRKQNKNRAHSV